MKAGNKKQNEINKINKHKKQNGVKCRMSEIRTGIMEWEQMEQIRMEGDRSKHQVQGI